MTTTVLAVVSIICVICGMVAATIADRKGLSAGGYFLLGIVLGLLGVAIAAIVQPRQVTPAPGWYEDPWHLSPRRYFDGHQWTGHTQ